MFEKQLYQISFTVIAAALLLILGKDLEGNSKMWLQIGIAIAIAHHTYVWLAWRLELYHKWITKKFGKSGFEKYVIGFFILFASRLLSTIILTCYDINSISIPNLIKWSIITIMALLSGYTFYSVGRYFGMKRATGADHFFEKYQKMPFVKKGMFKYTSNGMYMFGTLIILLPGIIGESYFAIMLGLFNYIYAWVHYHCLEKPDIKKIYKKTN